MFKILRSVAKISGHLQMDTETTHTDIIGCMKMRLGTYWAETFEMMLHN